MLKMGYGLTVVSALVFSAGVVNNGFVSQVMAEEEKKEKEEKSGELI